MDTFIVDLDETPLGINEALELMMPLLNALWLVTDVPTGLSRTLATQNSQVIHRALVAAFEDSIESISLAETQIDLGGPGGSGKMPDAETRLLGLYFMGEPVMDLAASIASDPSHDLGARFRALEVIQRRGQASDRVNRRLLKLFRTVRALLSDSVLGEGIHNRFAIAVMDTFDVLKLELPYSEIKDSFPFARIGNPTALAAGEWR